MREEKARCDDHQTRRERPNGLPEQLFIVGGRSKHGTNETKRLWSLNDFGLNVVASSLMLLLLHFVVVVLCA
jgi:hypothetical protein